MNMPIIEIEGKDALLKKLNQNVFSPRKWVVSGKLKKFPFDFFYLTSKLKGMNTAYWNKKILLEKLITEMNNA